MLVRFVSGISNLSVRDRDVGNVHAVDPNLRGSIDADAVNRHPAHILEIDGSIATSVVADDQVTAASIGGDTIRRILDQANVLDGDALTVDDRNRSARHLLDRAAGERESAGGILKCDGVFDGPGYRSR